MNKMIPPLGHEQVLLLALQITVLLFAARALGELMRRMGQPTVVGELLAGVILGPSVLGALLPHFRGWLFPASAEQSHLLQVISWLGVMLLLAVTGLETDLELIRQQGRPALLTALLGIVVPFGFGLALGWFIPRELMAHANQRLIFSLFVATAMSISAIPVIAKILLDLNLIRRDIGQVTLAAGMANDAAGWIILSVIAGLATSGSLDWAVIGKSLGGTLIFLAAGLSLGQKLVDLLFGWMRYHGLNDDAILSGAFVLIFAAGTITQALGLEAMLGAFVAGIVLNRSPRFGSGPSHTIEKITMAVFAPIFFAGAGLQINLLQLASVKLALVAAAVLFTACVGKFAGAYVGARWGGMSHWESLTLGAGMNARGAMEIIIAIIGLSLGILTPPMYTVIVLMAVATSLMAPPLLRWTLRGVPLKPEEEDRLKEEAASSKSLIANVNRVLLPSRGGGNSQLASQLIGRLSHHQFLEVTALFTIEPDQGNGHRRRPAPEEPALDKEDAQAALETVRSEMNLGQDGDLMTKVISSGSGADAILEEAEKEYDLLVIGASKTTGRRGPLFSDLVDRVVQNAPCATLIVKSIHPAGFRNPIPTEKLDRILVPTVGSDYSLHAAELAFALASSSGATVNLLHVVNRGQLNGIMGKGRSEVEDAVDIAHQIVYHQAERGQQMGAKVEKQVEVRDSPEAEIVRVAREGSYDLLIMGTKRRTVSGRVFFGHRVEYILRHAPCPVALLSTG